ncbi:MAG: hypothetical protein ACUVUE_07430 [Candidatus Bathycorpusculaceae bacterium]
MTLSIIVPWCYHAERLTIEARKFEVRLKEFAEAGDATVKALKAFIRKVNELTGEEKHVPPEKATKLRLEILKAFQDAMSCMSRAEHERSHLLESYGSILLALERQVSAAKAKF